MAIQAKGLNFRGCSGSGCTGEGHKRTGACQEQGTLQSIIDSDSLSDAQKQDAVAQMVAMTEIAEKKQAAETMLASKGFLDSVVSISEDSADVVVNASELTEANRAQIEDIVTRKTGVAAQNIVITPVYAEGK